MDRTTAILEHMDSLGFYLQHVMQFAEAAQDVQVHRAQAKPKFADQPLPPPPSVTTKASFTRGGRRKHTASELASGPPSKKVSAERLPHAPVPLGEIYNLPPFPQIQVINCSIIVLQCTFYCLAFYVYVWDCIII